MSSFYVICVIWHKMSYYDEWSIWHRNMTFGRPWCLNDRLDLSIRLWLNKNLSEENIWKMCWKIFLFINFENPVYFQPNLKLHFCVSKWPRIKKFKLRNFSELNKIFVLSHWALLPRLRYLFCLSVGRQIKFCLVTREWIPSVVTGIIPYFQVIVRYFDKVLKELGDHL
jgi:hypothetical protein